MESVLLEIGRDHLQFPSFKVRGGTVAFFQWWIFFHYFRLSNAVMVSSLFCHTDKISNHVHFFSLSLCVYIYIYIYSLVARNAVGILVR